MRERVRPGPDEALARARQAFEQAQHAVGVAVGPAADGVHGDLDGRVVFAHRPVLPVRVAPLVRQPGVDPRLVGREPQVPELAPALPDGGLVRRLALPVQHARAPVQQIGGQHAAALVVHVVGVAVVGAHECDDRFERRRAAGGQLEAVEAAPRDAGHADGAAAPRLRRDPGDDLEQVLLLLRVVLVLEHTVRLAAAAQVHAHAGVTAGGPVRVDEHVARGHAVAEPVRHRLEDAGHGVGLRVHRQPHTGREARPVAHRDPDVVQLPDLAKRCVAPGHVDLHLGCGTESECIRRSESAATYPRAPSSTPHELGDGEVCRLGVSVKDDAKDGATSDARSGATSVADPPRHYVSPDTRSAPSS